MYALYKDSLLSRVFRIFRGMISITNLPDRTGVQMHCMCSVRAVWAACRLQLHCNCTAISLEWNCSVYLQPPLQIHSMYSSVSAVYTAGHCRYTAVRAGRLNRLYVFKCWAE